MITIREIPYKPAYPYEVHVKPGSEDVASSIICNNITSGAYDCQYNMFFFKDDVTRSIAAALLKRNRIAINIVNPPKFHE